MILRNLLVVWFGPLNLIQSLRSRFIRRVKTHGLVKRKILYKLLEQLLEVMGPLTLWSDLLSPDNNVTVEQDILLIQRVLRRRWQRLQRHGAVNSHAVMIQPTFVERRPFWVWQEGKTAPVQVVQINTVPSETQDKPNSWQTQLIVSTRQVGTQGIRSASTTSWESSTMSAQLEKDYLGPLNLADSIT